jgi:hypothetical protein
VPDGGNKKKEFFGLLRSSCEKGNRKTWPADSASSVAECSPEFFRLFFVVCFGNSSADVSCGCRYVANDCEILRLANKLDDSMG